MLAVPGLTVTSNSSDIRNSAAVKNSLSSDSSSSIIVISITCSVISASNVRVVVVGLKSRKP